MLTTRRVFNRGSGLTQLIKITLALVLSAAIITGCEVGIPKEALQLTNESLEQRQLQTRRFETLDEAKLLSAAAGVLQDLGFNIDESETKLGLIVASKDRDATDPAQVTFVVIISLLNALGGKATDMPYDTQQKIRVSLVSRPGSIDGNTAVRVTFHRTVWNNKGQVTMMENLNTPTLYQEFFEKLSKSVFLEAHKI